MFNKNHLLFTLLLLNTGCAVAPLSKQAFGIQPPLFKNSVDTDIARISSSSEKKYESVKGIPRAGELVVCTEDGLKTTIEGEKKVNPIVVPANKKIVLTSVIQWANSGWEGTCWPFVSFTPESGGDYVVVNEVVGGKGVSALWTGIAFQSCEVSVYKLGDGSFTQVVTEKIQPPVCGHK